jgi:hypothetical protein
MLLIIKFEPLTSVAQTRKSSDIGMTGDNVAMPADVCLCGGTAHDVTIGLPICTVYGYVSIIIHRFTI